MFFPTNLYFKDFLPKTRWKKHKKYIFGISASNSIEPCIIQQNQNSARFLPLMHLNWFWDHLEGPSATSDVYLFNSVFYAEYTSRLELLSETTNRASQKLNQPNSAVSSNWKSRLAREKRFKSGVRTVLIFVSIDEFCRAKHDEVFQKFSVSAKLLWQR